MGLAACVSSALASPQQWVVTWNCQLSGLFSPELLLLKVFCITAMKSSSFEGSAV